MVTSSHSEQSVHLGECDSIHNMNIDHSHLMEGQDTITFTAYPPESIQWIVHKNCNIAAAIWREDTERMRASADALGDFKMHGQPNWWKYEKVATNQRASFMKYQRILIFFIHGTYTLAEIIRDEVVVVDDIPENLYSFIHGMYTLAEIIGDSDDEDSSILENPYPFIHGRYTWADFIIEEKLSKRVHAFFDNSNQESLLGAALPQTRPTL
eukprot:scaffold945_cov170-Amphora_coffeaeformis.AAC.5